MFVKKKTKPPKGFQPVPRKRSEVEREYADSAIQLGHKTRIFHQKDEELKALHQEMLAHVADLTRLNKEAMALPPDEPPPPAPEAA